LAPRSSPPCYHCGSDCRRLYAQENGYDLVRCLACGLLYVCPRPGDEELLRAHALGVHAGTDAPVFCTGAFDDGKCCGYEPVLRDLYRAGPPIRPDGLWLDMGCGHGEFLVALDVFCSGRLRLRGVEPNEQKRAGAVARGLDVRPIGHAEPAAALDGVSLLNVYSHLPDPPAFLRDLRRMVRDGGELLLQTGDTADLDADAHPRPFYLPDHLSFASERIVRNILERAGFRVIAVRKYPTYPCQAGPGELAREFVKCVLLRPGSRFAPLLAAYRLSRRYRTDMYLRAVAV
jgi:SAM-dependent methyltransferase